MVVIRSFLLVVLLVKLPMAFGQNKPLQKKVDALAARHLKNPENAGLAIAMVNNGKETAYCYGVKDKFSLEPILPNTLFEIGSITKLFTSLILAREVQEGNYILDKPIRDFFPPGSINKNFGNINLRHLATHSSGLPRLAENFWPTVTDKTNPYHSYNSALLMEYLSNGNPSSPGGSYGYSNFGYGLLGYILAQKYQCSYDNLVREKVCQPLGLSNTRVLLRHKQPENLALGHSRGKVAANWDFLDATAGQGALKSDITDMLAFLKANTNPGTTLFPEAFRLAQQVHFSDHAKAVNTGLGWHIGGFYGEKYLEHTGGTGGYRSYIGICPNTGIGVVVLSNSDNDVAPLGIELLKLLKDSSAL